MTRPRAPRPYASATPLLVILLLAVQAGQAGTAMAGDGSLDPDFASGGIFGYTAGGTFTGFLLPAPDGGVVVWGTRLLSDLSQQLHWRRFGAGGAGPLCTFSLPSDSHLSAWAAAFDPEGRLLILARHNISGDLGVLRVLYPGCQPDTTLDGDGFVSHSLNGFGLEGPSGVGIASANWLEPGLVVVIRRRILVVMNVDDPNDGSSSNVYLLRLFNNGSLDTAFGDGDGLLQIASGRRASGLLRAAAGKFLVVGVVTPAPVPDLDTFVLRIDRDGAPDPSWSGDGEVVIDLSPAGDSYDRLVNAQLLDDGRVLLAGATDLGAAPDVGLRGAAALLTTNGALDTSFSDDGWLSHRFPGAYTTVFTGAVLRPHGKPVVGGLADVGPDLGDLDSLGFALRFGLDGALDAKFGSDGAVIFNPNLLSHGEDVVSGVALAVDGLWVQGMVDVPTGSPNPARRPFVARLLDGPIFADDFESGDPGAWSVAVP